MLGLYQKRTGKSKEELEVLMREDRQMSATEALEWGFVDNVIINNKLKIAAMAEEQEKKEVPEIDAIKAENDELKKKIETLMAKLKAYEEEKEKDKEAKVEEKVESYLKAGKIKAETKKAWMQIGLADYDTMTATLDNIQVVINPDLNKVPDTEKPVAYATKDEAFTAYKEGKIKTLKELEELTKTMEG
jgi:enoyl-CoA hydratase/carnithine racemase